MNQVLSCAVLAKCELRTWKAQGPYSLQDGQERRWALEDARRGPAHTAHRMLLLPQSSSCLGIVTLSSTQPGPYPMLLSPALREPRTFRRQEQNRFRS